MARPGPSSRGQLHVWRYLGALLVLFVALYTTVAFAGQGSAWLKPKLGLDLQGGAQVILTPKTESGKTASSAQLSTAVDILRQRVNGAGVSEAEVFVEGEQIVVQVPGGNRDSIKAATKTAQLQMRRLVESAPVVPTTPPTTAPSATPSAAVSTPTASATPKKRPVTAGLVQAGTPTPTSTPSATPSPSEAPADAGPLVRSGDVYSPQAFALLDCSDPKARLGGAPDAPNQEIVACDRFGTEKYHLAVAKVVGKDVKGANVGTDSLGTQIKVVVSFKGKGQDKFTNLTKEAFGATPPTNRVAIVLDGVVYSAPTIQNVINGDAEITGGFSQKEAEQLANVLKFGALPLNFESGDAEVISASLGDDQLRSGLIAGGIGLAAVVVYSLLYYRMLGFITISSLLVSGGLTYAMVCVLGKQIGFALSLAGIAGFIVAVGITADSFVVYFERLKDEIKEGRTPRSAVDVAWKRAIRTILNADAVSLLAAVLLYFFSVGGVRGFAFTLGLSTILDLVVVTLFTRPLISLLSRQRWFSRTGPTGFYGPDGGQPSTGATRPSLTTPQEA
ncbi:MAG TPA: protein translocase subunit SecD [Mycobacteriales bacterium]|nr:protein translocase subunit SecD [Mycobacteriales bacterium]